MDKGQKGFIVYGDIKATLDELNDKQAADLFLLTVTLDYLSEDPSAHFHDCLKMRR